MTMTLTDFDAELHRAHADLSADRYRDAHARILALASQPVYDAQRTLSLLRLLNYICDANGTLSVLARSDSANWPLPALLEATVIASDAGDPDCARQLAASALRLAPNNAFAHQVDATLRMFAGDIAGARAGAEHALALSPGLARAHWLLSQLGGTTPAQADRVKHSLARVPANSEDEACLAFALHHMLHEQDDHAAAWTALQRGCAAKRARVRYDHAAELALLEHVRECCDATFCRSNDGVEERGPIFIVGMHRSGTTLLERLLGRHSQITAAGEHYTFTTQLRFAADHRCSDVLDARILERARAMNFNALGTNYLAASRWRAHGRAYWTEKLPSNFVNLGLIARAMPNARFLHLVRAPREVCFANLRMQFSHVNGYSYDQHQLADYYAGYRTLMAHWHEVLPGRVLDVSHHDLVRDPERSLRGVMQHLGLDFELPMLAAGAPARAVTSASAAQVHGAIHPRSNAWRPYAAHLTALFERLALHGVAQ